MPVVCGSWRGHVSSVPVLYYPVRRQIMGKIACLDCVVPPFNSGWLHSDTFKWPSSENPHFPEGLKTTGALAERNYLLFRPNYLLTFNPFHFKPVWTLITDRRSHRPPWRNTDKQTPCRETEVVVNTCLQNLNLISY